MRVHHRSIFLVIVQAWIVPCHGFAYTPHSLGSVGLASSPTARHASFAGPLPCPPTAGDRGTLSSLSMSDQEGGPFDPYRDEVRKSYDCTVAAEYLLRRLWLRCCIPRGQVERATRYIHAAPPSVSVSLIHAQCGRFPTAAVHLYIQE